VEGRPNGVDEEFDSIQGVSIKPGRCDLSIEPNTRVMIQTGSKRMDLERAFEKQGSIIYNEAGRRIAARK
jgi:hypothetical protein